MYLLAQESGEAVGGGIGGVIVLMISLALVVAVIAGMWKVYAKAGQPGIACIVPIWNIIALLEIAGRPIWWVLLFFIPVVNAIVSVIVMIDVAKKFGKDLGWGLGLAFLGFIFFPILGFGDAQYQG